jgi:glycosyltransferase involved in cell wall biosynthesis
MNIWAIKIGETVPLINARQRCMRTALIAENLARRGHHVLWWTSSFDHARKYHIFAEDHFYRHKENFDIYLIKTPGYKKHISLARLWDHHIMAKRLSKLMQTVPVPDLIISAFPVPRICLAASRFSKTNNIPFVVDIRDLWPDLFWYQFPKTLRWLGKLLMHGMDKTTQEVCREASALIGITPAFVDWGLGKANRDKNEYDRDFPLAYPTNKVQENNIEKARIYWDSLGIEKRTGVFIICYIGTISKKAQIEPILKAASILNKTKPGGFKFVICGDGDDLRRLKRKYHDVPNVVFSGWINSDQIHYLMNISDIGLNNLPNRDDFLATVNNKAIEYMSAGLPVLSSPNQGFLHDLIQENNIGVTFDIKDENQLADSLVMLSEDSTRMKAMSFNSKKVFNEHFVAEEVYSQMAQHIEAIAQQKIKR